ncbi:DUF2971 domain-containing protein [Mesorhizobium sp. LjNodule214]|uniref:DUF2971 domain-containing protein n=1 Tax=Mesorhizobium sp. LjNodule214 TaxID=3342252 RepID=UPI003ECC9630
MVTSNPNKLSHYTDLSGLLGIIEKGQFWASNVSFLNDREELRHDLEYLRKILKGNRGRANSRWTTALKNAVAEIDKSGIPDIYAVCFCQRSDELSLWRGYGQANQNVSIQFRTTKLKSMLSDHSVKLSAVLYVEKEKIKFLTEGLSLTYKNNFDDDRLTRAALSEITRRIPLCKHYGFRDEREWRAVTRPMKDDEVFFRTSRGVLVPYLKIGPEKADEMGFESITVGPGPDPELTAQSIRQLLLKYKVDIPVKVSSVPFRT